MADIALPTDSEVAGESTLAIAQCYMNNRVDSASREMQLMINRKSKGGYDLTLREFGAIMHALGYGIEIKVDPRVDIWGR